jgi:HEPN domain-containing protein
MDAKLKLVHNWLVKASRDIDSAKLLASAKKPILDTAIYHCQQAAEKCLKGWLVYHDQRIEKTHDIRLLVTLASNIEPEFRKYFEAGEYLTPYVTAYRYPGEAVDPSRNEFDLALKYAQEIYHFVKSFFPD